MLGSPTTFWGKLRHAATGEVVEWHPLIAHCADVAAVCEALLTRTLLGPRLAHVAGREALDDATVARLCFFAALHDLGKLNHGFQAKALPHDAKVERRGHVGDALSLFNVQGRDAELVALVSQLPLSDFSVWGGEEVSGHLLFAALGHHGRPGNVALARFERDVWRPRGDRDPVAGLGALVSAARAWFPNAFVPNGLPLPTEPAFQHAFAGLVTLADWIGSDASADAFRFQSELDPPDRMPFARERAARVIAALGLDVTAARGSLGGNAPVFEDVWPRFKPCGAQPVFRRGGVRT